MENKIIIGLVGQIACGKNTIADYIVEKHGGVSMNFSQPLRETLNRVYLPVNRENLAWLAQSLLDRFGSDILSKIIGEEINKSDKKIFILTNIRREGDVALFDNWPSYTLIGVKADPKVCYERLIQRNKNDDDKTKTWEEFKEDLKLSTEADTDMLVKKSSIMINNDGSLEDLYKKVDEVMKKLSI